MSPRWAEDDPLDDDDLGDDDLGDEEDEDDSDSTDNETKVCPDCQGDVYEEADACPHCGYFFLRDENPISHWPWPLIVLGAIGITAVLAGCLWFLLLM